MQSLDFDEAAHKKKAGILGRTQSFNDNSQRPGNITLSSAAAERQYLPPKTLGDDQIKYFCWGNFYLVRISDYRLFLVSLENLPARRAKWMTPRKKGAPPHYPVASPAAPS